MPTVQHRHMTKPQWAQLNPILSEAEIGLEIGIDGTPDRFKIGNGVSTWNELLYFLSEADINIDVNRLSEETLDSRYSKVFGGATLASMGDSLTAGNSDIDGPYVAYRYSWANMGVLLSGSRLRYIGDAATGGYDIQQIRAEHLPKILEKHPTYCTVLAGQNSLTGFDQQDINDLMAIYTSLMNAGITPILVSNPPISVSTEHFRLNNFVAAFAQAKGVPYFDMGAVLINPETGLYKSGMSADNVHPQTPLACAALSKAFGSFLTSMLPQRVQSPAYLLPQSKKDGEVFNPLLAPYSTNPSYPDLWVPTINFTASLTDTTVGKKFRMTKVAANRAQANGPMHVLTPGTEHFVSFRMEATVEAMNGEWTFSLLDLANGYAPIVAFQSQPVDVAPDTIVSVKFRVPSTGTSAPDLGKVLPVIQLHGSGQAEGGALNATMAISQFRIRPSEV